MLLLVDILIGTIRKSPPLCRSRTGNRLGFEHIVSIGAFTVRLSVRDGLLLRLVDVSDRVSQDGWRGKYPS